MNEFNKKEKKEFVSRFRRSSSIQSFKEAFLEVFGKDVQLVFLDYRFRPLKDSWKNLREANSLAKLLKVNCSKRKFAFYCRCDKPSLIIPIKQGYNTYGYILILHVKIMLQEKDISCMEAFIGIALKEFQKEQELTKLYDTIRPRAIALSTIHTIHRLLSSTLDMNELIERIARLTLQVLRAGCCSIMLIDDSKKHLIPKAIIGLNNNSGRVKQACKKIKIGLGRVGKVGKTGKAFLSRTLICVPLVEEDIIGVICARNKENNVSFNKFDLEILLTLAEQAVIAINNAQLYEEQKKMADGSIKSLAALLDAKSPEIYTHSEDFLKIVLAIAEEMRLSSEETRNLRYAALLPDTGRFTIPDEIFKKRGDLSKKEFGIIKKQHIESLKILEPLEFLKPAMPVIIHHHERYDGSGYPDGLKGKKIPMGARIMAVADAFEAMLSSRPYKDGRITIEQALEEIESNKGSQFDPDVVDAFMSIIKRPRFRELFKA